MWLFMQRFSSSLLCGYTSTDMQEHLLSLAVVLHTLGSTSFDYGMAEEWIRACILYVYRADQFSCYQHISNDCLYNSNVHIYSLVIGKNENIKNEPNLNKGQNLA